MSRLYIEKKRRKWGNGRVSGVTSPALTSSHATKVMALHPAPRFLDNKTQIIPTKYRPIDLHVEARRPGLSSSPVRI